MNWAFAENELALLSVPNENRKGKRESKGTDTEFPGRGCMKGKLLFAELLGFQQVLSVLRFFYFFFWFHVSENHTP